MKLAALLLFAGGSSGSEVTNGGGCAARRRLTLDSHEEEDEEKRPRAKVWKRQQEAEANNAVAAAAAGHPCSGDDPCSDSGDDSWRPLFATRQRGRRTRFSDLPAAKPNAMDAAANGSTPQTDAAPAAAAAGPDSAAEEQPEKTLKLIKTALLPSPASSARVSHGHVYRFSCQDATAATAQSMARKVLQILVLNVIIISNKTILCFIRLCPCRIDSPSHCSNRRLSAQGGASRRPLHPAALKRCAHSWHGISYHYVTCFADCHCYPRCIPTHTPGMGPPGAQQLTANHVSSSQD